MDAGEEKTAARAAGGGPRGIEVLVKKASVDPAFRSVLLARRSAAAGEIGLELTPQEAAILDSIPADQLEAIIKRTKVDPSKRNLFLGLAAAAMLAAAGAAAVFDMVTATKGIGPDRPHKPAATAPSLPGSHSATGPSAGGSTR